MSESESRKIPIGGQDTTAEPERGEPSGSRQRLKDTAVEMPRVTSPAEDALAKLQAEKAELVQTLVRRQADFENYRKRVERDRHEESRRGVAKILEDLLPVLDGFDRALQSFGEGETNEHIRGMQLVQKQLWDALAKNGLTRIEALGKHFDPHVHLALERVETTEHPDGTVLDVLQEGYRFHDRVLRPSVVRVAVHPAERSATHAHTTKATN